MTFQRADAEPFIVENGDGAGDFVVVCEHASNVIPERFAALGLSDEVLQTHIAGVFSKLFQRRHPFDRRCKSGSDHT